MALLFRPRRAGSSSSGLSRRTLILPPAMWSIDSTLCWPKTSSGWQKDSPLMWCTIDRQASSGLSANGFQHLLSLSCIFLSFLSSFSFLSWLRCFSLFLCFFFVMENQCTSFSSFQLSPKMDASTREQIVNQILSGPQASSVQIRAAKLVEEKEPTEAEKKQKLQEAKTLLFFFLSFSFNF